MKDLTAALPATLVASLALAVAVTGTASALAGKGSIDKDDLQKNIVTSKTVKNGSLKGADLKKDSVTGAQVKESTLKTVPSAASVESLKFFDISLAEGQSGQLLSVAPLSVLALCIDEAGSTKGIVLASTTVDGTAFAGDDASGIIGPSSAEADRDFEEGTTDAASGTATTSDGYDDQFWLKAPDGTAVFGTVGTVANADTNSCQFFGTYTTTG